MRTGWNETKPIALNLVRNIQEWRIDGLAAVMVSLFFMIQVREVHTTTLLNYVRYTVLQDCKDIQN